MSINPYGRSRNPNGRPSKWKLGKTKMIRVPVVLSEELLRVAHVIDKRGLRVLNQSLEQLESISFMEKTLSESRISLGCSGSSDSTVA